MILKKFWPGLYVFAALFILFHGIPWLFSEEPKTGTIMTVSPAGTMTSTENANGSWTHEWSARDAGGKVVTRILDPHKDENYPHSDHRFWPPSTKGPGRVETSLSAKNGKEQKLISTRDETGFWLHHLISTDEKGKSSEKVLLPQDEFYPKNDSRFDPPSYEVRKENKIKELERRREDLLMGPEIEEPDDQDDRGDDAIGRKIELELIEKELADLKGPWRIDAEERQAWEEERKKKYMLPDKDPSESILGDLDKKPIDPTPPKDQPEAPQPSHPSTQEKPKPPADVQMQNFIDLLKDRQAEMENRFGPGKIIETVKAAMKDQGVADSRILGSSHADFWASSFSETWGKINGDAMHSPSIKELAKSKKIIETDPENARWLISDIEQRIETWKDVHRAVDRYFDEALKTTGELGKLWEKYQKVSDEFEKTFKKNLSNKDFKGDRRKRADDLSKKTDEGHADVEKEMKPVNNHLANLLKQAVKAARMRPSLILKAPEKKAAAPPNPQEKASREKMEDACRERKEAESEAESLKPYIEEAEKEVKRNEDIVSKEMEVEGTAEFQYQEAVTRNASAEEIETRKQVLEASRDILKQERQDLAYADRHLANLRSLLQGVQERARLLRKDCDNETATYKRR